MGDHLAQAIYRAHKGLNARQPTLKGGGAQVGQGADCLRETIQIANNGNEEGRPERRTQPAAHARRSVGIFRVGGGNGAVGQAIRAHNRERKKHGDGQVEGHLSVDARKLDQIAYKINAKVIVIDVPARKVWVYRWEVRAAHDTVQEGHFHELLAAKPGLPDVRV